MIRKKINIPMHPDDIPNPTDEQLQALDREVSFVPSENDDPKVLSSEQIDHYNEFGYLMPFDGLDGGEIRDLRNFFEGALEAFRNLGRDSYSISTAHLRFARIHQLLSHPAILGSVSDLLGQNLVGWGAHFFCKLPKDGKAVPWHQDAIYWPITPTRTVTVWLAIDDADPENANMRFIPRSHLHGTIEYQRMDDPNAVLDFTNGLIAHYPFDGNANRQHGQGPPPVPALYLLPKGVDQGT